MLSDLYPPIIGGLEQHVRNLAHALAKRGHEVSVATMRQHGRPASWIDDGVRVHGLRGTLERAGDLFVDPLKPFAPPIADPEIVRSLRRVVRRERPEIVHAHNWLVHSFLPLKHESRARLVRSLHDYSLICAKKSLLFQGEPCSGPGLRKCLGCASDHYGVLKGIPITLSNWEMGLAEQRLVDLFVPVSASVAVGNELSERGLPFEVIPNFVPDDVASLGLMNDARLEDLPQEPFLLFVGILGRYKGVEVLMDAYARMQDAPPLVIIGPRAPDTPNDLPHGVIALHDWPHASVMAAWHRSSVAIIPSIYPDACPTVAMEAMATGRPVVASRIGGLPDLVDHERTGILVPPGDPVALAAALTRLVGEPALRARMGTAGGDKVKSFFASTVAERMEGIYERLLYSSGARAGERGGTSTRRELIGAKAVPGTQHAGSGPRRLFVTGGPGSGKSSFARRIASTSGIPAHHLDDIARVGGGNGPERPLEDRMHAIDLILDQDDWVAEGIHLDWTDRLMAGADQIIWLDYVSGSQASRRVVARFLSTALAESRRQKGWRKFARFGDYWRNLRHLVAAVPEARRYYADDERSKRLDGLTRRATTAQRLARFEAKVVHCRDRGESEVWLERFLRGREHLQRSGEATVFSEAP
jgi:glycosyltransferase involved in cell wall biosynthesis